VREQLTPERLGVLDESVTSGHGSDRAAEDGAYPVVVHDAQLNTWRQPPLREPGATHRELIFSDDRGRSPGAWRAW
jgi:hypothetical protein